MKNKILDGLLDTQKNIIDDLDFIINKIYSLSPSLSSRETGFYIASSFSIYCSLYEKFSKEVIIKLQDIIVKTPSKNTLDYLIAANHRNPIPGEKELDNFNILRIFKSNFDDNKKCIANSFITSNKGIDSISFIANFLEIENMDEADFNSYKSLNISNVLISKVSLVTSFNNLQDILKNNYTNRNNACHGQFKTIEIFSANSLIDEALLCLLCLKLYIIITYDYFVNYLNSKL